jgi:ADP-ribose pyrophosphatase
VKNKPSWKRIQSDQLLEHSRLNVYEDTVILPNKKKAQYIHFGDHPDSVVIIVKRKDGKILVLKEYSYPPNKWLYQFPGGMIEHGESPAIGAARELCEETNLEGDLKEIGWFYPDFRRKKEKQYVFVATNVSPKKGKKDQEEEFEYYWRSVEEIEKMIKSNLITTFNTLASWSIFKVNIAN